MVRFPRILIALGILLISGLPVGATLPSLRIIMESVSPYFLPSTARVAAGTPIRWDNPTATFHTVTADACLTGEGPCAFDSGSVPPDGSYTVPSLPPGHYPYHCRLHPIMRGVLTVVAPSASPSQT
jgi:plastocyanin